MYQVLRKNGEVSVISGRVEHIFDKYGVYRDTVTNAYPYTNAAAVCAVSVLVSSGFCEIGFFDTNSFKVYKSGLELGVIMAMIQSVGSYSYLLKKGGIQNSIRYSQAIFLYGNSVMFDRIITLLKCEVVA